MSQLFFKAITQISSKLPRGEEREPTPERMGNGRRAHYNNYLAQQQQALPSFLPVSLEKKRVGVDLNFNGGRGERGESIRILFVPHSKVVIAASQQIWTAAAVATENMIRPSVEGGSILSPA